VQPLNPFHPVFIGILRGLLNRREGAKQRQGNEKILHYYRSALLTILAVDQLPI